MSIANPTALLLLLLIPLVILLHTIRTRRQHLSVSSLFFWRRTLREHDRAFRLRTLLRNLLLLLQLLAVLLLVLALAGPGMLRTVSTSQSHLILILDSSASMKSRESGITRFEQAKGLLLDLISDLPGNTRLMYFLAGAKPTLKSPYTRDREALKQLIRESRATDESGNLREAILMGMSLAERERGDEIWVVTDGAFDDIPGIDAANTALRFYTVGSEADNVGITQFQFRRRYSDPTEYEILVGVHSFSPRRIETDIALSMDRRVIVEDELTLAPWEDKILIYPYEGLIAGKAVARIGLADALALDNRAYAVLTETAEIKVLLLGEGNIFLESALAVYPNVRLDKRRWAVSYDPYDIVIFDRTIPPPLSRGRILLMGTPAPDLAIRSKGSVANPAISQWTQDHPILESVNLGGIAIARALDVDLGREMEILAGAGNVPLLAAMENSSIKLVYLGFNILESDLPLRVAFPVLIDNILSWLYPGSLSSSSQQLRAGETLALDAGVRPSGVRPPEVTVLKPDGSSKVVPVPSLFDETTEAGFYTVRGGDREWVFAVNLLSRDESDIRPRFQIPAEADPGKQAVSAMGKTKIDLWPLLALLAALLILAEWYLWVRE